ncbi:MAG: M14 family metallopeptidase [Chloroflexota bacterium]
MTDISTLFPENYEASRGRFRKNLARVQTMWPNAQLSQHRLASSEDLTIDWIHATALKQNDKVFVLTTGEHGIECYVGSAMLQRFIEMYLHQLDPNDTGLLLVHAINPWGMKHRRRTNRFNVDLNRNFVWNPEDLDLTFNPGYDDLNSFLNPQSPIPSLFWRQLGILLQLARHLLSKGKDSLREAVLLGQYRYPKGLFFGGDTIQEETALIRGLYQNVLGQYDHMVHLDMHTGYGPRYQMSLVNSVLEERGSAQLSQIFDYPLIVAVNTEEFYFIRGDMIDYVYTLRDKIFPQKRLYATSFEFGTYGESDLAMIRNLRIVILENQLHWHGTSMLEVEKRVRYLFGELFAPQGADWRAKAVADADRAFQGILRSEGFI